jgi:hypothetical protein
MTRFSGSCTPGAHDPLKTGASVGDISPCLPRRAAGRDSLLADTRLSHRPRSRPAFMSARVSPLPRWAMSEACYRRMAEGVQTAPSVTINATQAVPRGWPRGGITCPGSKRAVMFRKGNAPWPLLAAIVTPEVLAFGERFSVVVGCVEAHAVQQLDHLPSRIRGATRRG